MVGRRRITSRQIADGVAERRVGAATRAAILLYCRTAIQRKHGDSAAQAAQVQCVAAGVLRYNGDFTGGGVRNQSHGDQNVCPGVASARGSWRITPVTNYARKRGNYLQTEVVEFEARWRKQRLMTASGPSARYENGTAFDRATRLEKLLPSRPSRAWTGHPGGGQLA